jgi:hypothetical protein
MVNTAEKAQKNLARTRQMAGQTTLMSAIFFIALGGVSIAWYFVDPLSKFTLITGGLFLAYGLFTLTRAAALAPVTPKSGRNRDTN